MEELQLASLEQTEITAWNFNALKEELSKALSEYKNTVYTDETIKLAKEDKKKLADAKNIIEKQRKAFKAKCMEPYDAIEPQVKELVAMIEEQRVAVDDVVKNYTERQKEEKKAKIKDYYDKKAHVLGDLAQPLFEKLLDPKWLTASSGNKYQEELQIKINDALSDIKVILAMDSPFVDTLIEKYVATLSLEEAKAKHDELVEAAQKAGLGQQTSQQIVQQPVVQQQEQEPSADTETGILVKMYGDKNQITQVMDFAKALGVRIEIQ